MIPARHASLRARPGRSGGRCPAGRPSAHPSGSPGPWSPPPSQPRHRPSGAGRWGRSRCTPRTPHPAGARDGRPGSGACPSTWARCLGAAIASSCFFSIAPCREETVNRPWHFPCPSSTIRNDAAASASRSSVVQQPGFVGLADLRGDHLQDPVPQDPQLLGVVVLGVPDQGRQRIRPDPVVEVGGQRLDRGHDHLGLVDQQPTLRQRHPDRLERLRPQRRGEPGLAVRRGTGLLRGVRPPVRRDWWHRSRPPPPPVWPWSATRSLQLGDWASSRVSSTIASRVSAGAHRPGRLRPGRSSGSSSIRDSRGPDRVSPIAGVRGVRHGPIRPPSTDTLGRSAGACG